MNEFELKAEQFLKEKGFHKVGEIWCFISEVDNKEHRYNEAGYNMLIRLLAEFADNKANEYSKELKDRFDKFIITKL